MKKVKQRLNKLPKVMKVLRSGLPMKEYKCSKGTGPEKTTSEENREQRVQAGSREPDDPSLIKQTLGTAPLGTSVSSSVKCKKKNNLFTGSREN